MEPEVSLPHSQMPATCPYSESARSSPCPPHPTSWRSILILSSHLRLFLPSGLFPSGFPHQYPAYTSPLPRIHYMPRQSHSSRFYHPNNIGWGVKVSSSLCIFLHSFATSFLLGPNILLNTLFSNTLSLCSSLNVRNQVSHAYKTTGKIIVTTCTKTHYNWEQMNNSRSQTDYKYVGK